MEHSGISAYLTLRRLDAEMTQSIIRFSEQITARHNLDPAVATDLKQGLCQFAIDLATRRATIAVMQG